MLACAKSKILLLSFIKLRVWEKEKGEVRRSESGREHTLLLSQDLRILRDRKFISGSVTSRVYMNDLVVLTLGIPSKVLSLFCICCVCNIRQKQRCCSPGLLGHLNLTAEVADPHRVTVRCAPVLDAGAEEGLTGDTECICLRIHF